MACRVWRSLWCVSVRAVFDAARPVRPVPPASSPGRLKPPALSYIIYFYCTKHHVWLSSFSLSLAMPSGCISATLRNASLVACSRDCVKDLCAYILVDFRRLDIFGGPFIVAPAGRKKRPPTATKTARPKAEPIA